MRLIDADALIEYMDARVFDLREMYGAYDHYTDGFEAALGIAENALTIDAVPVVRCKNCQYRDEAKVNKKGFLICPASGMEIMDDDFCSYGERRDDNDTSGA